VLVVSASHFIDRMLYLFGDVDVVSYCDDSRGGVEANCVARFQANLYGQPIKGSIILSKTHSLLNCLRIAGERGILEIGEGQTRSVMYFPANQERRHEITSLGKEGFEVDQDYFRVQLNDFLAAIQTGVSPKVNGRQGRKSVEITERCYGIATAKKELWCDSTLERLRLAML
jgi:predicted dehydrogenase